MPTKDIDTRLNEFSETHGAVLLGMHRELSSLKADVESKLAVVIKSADEKLVQFREEQAGILNKVEQASASDLANFKTDSSRLINQAMSLLDDTGKVAAEGLSGLKNEASRFHSNFDQARRNAVSEIELLVSTGRSALTVSRKELDDSQSKIVAYMSVQQRLLDEHAESVKNQQQAILKLQTLLNEKTALHQQMVERFNAKTRQFAIASLVLLSVLLAWYGVNQWMH